MQGFKTQVMMHSFNCKLTLSDANIYSLAAYMFCFKIGCSRSTGIVLNFIKMVQNFFF